MAILNRQQKVSDEIPSSAMADIAFLLLFFFLVTTTFPKDRGLPMTLPEEDSEQEVSQRNVLHLDIMPDGIVQVRRGDSQNTLPVGTRDIESLWRQEVAQNENLIAAVKTHPDAQHRYMIQVLDGLQSAGAIRIALQMQEG